MTRSLLRAALRLARLFRPLLGGAACRFEPSCSTYAAQAVETRPAPRALWLILRRLARCHPLHPGGWDPLPAP